jgi:hypothetical protein
LDANKQRKQGRWCARGTDAADQQGVHRNNDYNVSKISFDDNGYLRFSATQQ